MRIPIAPPLLSLWWTSSRTPFSKQRVVVVAIDWLFTLSLSPPKTAPTATCGALRLVATSHLTVQSIATSQHCAPLLYFSEISATAMSIGRKRGRVAASALCKCGNRGLDSICAAPVSARLPGLSLGRSRPDRVRFEAENHSDCTWFKLWCTSHSCSRRGGVGPDAPCLHLRVVLVVLRYGV